MVALTPILIFQHSSRMQGSMMATMLSGSIPTFNQATPFNGPPAKAYNTNPNIIIPINSSLYVVLVDTTILSLAQTSPILLIMSEPSFMMMSPSAAMKMNTPSGLILLMTCLIFMQIAVMVMDLVVVVGMDVNSDSSDDKDELESYQKKHLKELKKMKTVVSHGVLPNGAVDTTKRSGKPSQISDTPSQVIPTCTRVTKQTYLQCWDMILYPLTFRSHITLSLKDGQNMIKKRLCLVSLLSLFTRCH
jgi:hypothetical protein